MGALAQAPNPGSPARVPAVELLPAHNPRSVQAHGAAPSWVAGQDPEPDLDPVHGRAIKARGLGEEVRSAATRAAARHTQTAPAVPGAVLVAVEVEVAGVVEVRAGAIAGANAKVQNGDQAQE